MAKPRALGSDSVTLISDEAVYGTPRDGSGGGVFSRLALKSNGLDASQPLEADQLINTGNPDDTDPSLGSFDISGDIVAPLDARGAGFWLTMALGAEDDPVDNGGGTFTHTWTSGKDLAGYTIQTGHPKLATPKWTSVIGAKANGLSFPMARNGRALITLPMIGQSWVKDVGGTRDPDPSVFVYRPFDNASGSVKIGGAALANVIAAQFNLSNGLEAVPTIRDDGFNDGVDEAQRTAGGSLTLRLGTDHTIDDLIAAEDNAVLALAFKIKAAPTWALTFTMNRVFFELTKKPIEGPGGIQATVNFRAAYDSEGPNPMLVATLLNDVAAY